MSILHWWGFDGCSFQVSSQQIICLHLTSLSPQLNNHQPISPSQCLQLMLGACSLLHQLFLWPTPHFQSCPTWSLPKTTSQRQHLHLPNLQLIIPSVRQNYDLQIIRHSRSHFILLVIIQSKWERTEKRLLNSDELHFPHVSFLHVGSGQGQRSAVILHHS